MHLNAIGAIVIGTDYIHARGPTTRVSFRRIAPGLYIEVSSCIDRAYIRMASDANLDCKVTIFFNVKHLENSTRKSYINRAN